MNQVTDQNGKRWNCPEGLTTAPPHNTVVYLAAPFSREGFMKTTWLEGLPHNQRWLKAGLVFLNAEMARQCSDFVASMCGGEISDE